MDGEMLKKMFDGIDKQFLDVLVTENRGILSKTIKDINAKIEGDVARLAPAPVDIFRAFKICRWDAFKVIIVGQDPYPTAGDADGLSFSSRAKKVPDSLKKIYECLVHHKFLDEAPKHAVLDSWAEQGVLMLNASLTTEVGKKKEHFKIWDVYTDVVVCGLAAKRPDVVIIMWGNDAKSKGSVVEDHESSLTWAHPSPIVTANKKPDDPKNFKYCDNFTRCNSLLTSVGKTPINWGSISRHVVNVVPAVIAAVPDNAIRAGVTYVGTDGGSRGNGKTTCKASWAFCIHRDGVMVHTDKGAVVAKGVDTNNRGELEAITHAFDYLEKNVRGDVHIISDSEYAIGCLSVWAYSWRKDIEKARSSGKKNLDIIMPAITVLDRIKRNGKVTWEHVRSHKVAPNDEKSYAWFKWYLNDTCDKLTQTVF